MITTNENIFYDDKLLTLIKSNFNENDMELFNLNYKFYIANKNNIDDFIVDFNEVYKWIGFTRKDNAKTLLVSKNKDKKSLFEINKDYIIKMNTLIAPVVAGAIKSKGGENKETILLTINCFKKFCLKASTDKADKIYDYYIKMEDIITKYIENKHNENLYEINQNLELKNQEFENNKMLLEDTLTKLHLKNQEIDTFKNRKYEEIQKDKFIYIFSCDKPNIYKIGRSKDIPKRLKSLQTANVDDIKVEDFYQTSDDQLLEYIIHNILDPYRCKANREFFSANLNYIILIIKIVGQFIDTIKSTYEFINREELLDIIIDNLSNQIIINDNTFINSLEDNYYQSSDDKINKSNKINKSLNNIIKLNNHIEPNNNHIEPNNLHSEPIIDHIDSIKNNIEPIKSSILNYPKLKYGQKNSYRIIRTCQLCNSVLTASDSELLKHQQTYKCSKLKNINKQNTETNST